MRIRYTAGNEHSPTDRSGRVVVTIDPDGGAEVEHYAWTGGKHAWTARLDPSVLDRLASGLAEAGFPNMPSIQALSGDRMAELSVSGAPEDLRIKDGTVLVPHEDATTLPGYSEALTILDGLVRALGGPDHGAPPLDPPPSDVAEV